MEIDVPSVVAEVRGEFERYERALVANDVDAVDAFMWHDDRTVRVGVDDGQCGFDAISAFRRRQPRQTPPRTLRDTTIVTVGRDVAVVTTTFVPDDGSAPGRQQQTWVRFAEGWRIVAAHVSLAASWNRKAADQES